MLKLRNDDTAITSRPVNAIEPETDAISINSDNLVQSSSPTIPNVQSNRQRNPSVSSSCPSVNQDTPIRPKGYKSFF